MHKSITIAVNLLAAGMLLGNALAQQTPAAAPPPASSTASGTTSGTSGQASSPKTTTATKANSATTAKTAAPLALKTQSDKFSYAIGMKMGANFKKQAVAVNPAIVERGIKDGMAGGKTLLTDDEAQAAISDIQNQMRQKMMEKMQAAGAENKKEGDAFLAENKGKDGVKVLPSGLQYKVIKEGNGPKPASSDSVVCNYSGKLINGTEFDASSKHGGPATFPVTGVIKGWTEALQLMPVGSKWQLFIPSDLAYGERGAGGDIGPNATLIFDIELLSIADKSKDKNPAADSEKK